MPVDMPSINQKVEGLVKETVECAVARNAMEDLRSDPLHVPELMMQAAQRFHGTEARVQELLADLIDTQCTFLREQSAAGSTNGGR